MLVGHLAVALAAKSAEPRLPLGTAVAAAFGLDLLWPILLLAGAESVQIRAGDTAFTNLAFESYPWSHSLLVAAGWSLVAMVTARGLLGSWRLGAIVGALVLSHWLLDYLMHRPDLPLWLAGPLAGLGLWNSIPGTILVEGGLLVAGLWTYFRTTAARDRTGTGALGALVGVIGLMWITQPWAPPLPSARAVAWGALMLWLLPPWARWIEGHRMARGVA